MQNNKSQEAGTQLLYDALDLFSECDSSQRRLPSINYSSPILKNYKRNAELQHELDALPKYYHYSSTVKRKNEEKLPPKNGLVIKPIHKSLGSLATTRDVSNISLIGANFKSSSKYVNKNTSRCYPGSSMENVRSVAGDDKSVKSGNMRTNYLADQLRGDDIKQPFLSLADDVIFDPESHSQYVETLKNLAPIWLTNPGAHPKSVSKLFHLVNYEQR